jgi:formylglycine-generating enzyme required for sulfatase activity
MSVVGKLVCFGLAQALGEGAERLIGVVRDRCADHTQALPRALARANDRAWQALALALAGDSVFDGVARLFTTRDARALREQIQPFLARSAAHFDQTPADFRKTCLAELQDARHKGLLAATPPSADDLKRGGFSATASVTQDAGRALAGLADDLAPHCPNLAHLIRQPTPGGQPLLLASFTFFLRREVEGDEELARGLTFEGLRRLAADQTDGFVSLEQALGGLGGRFDEVVGQLGRIEVLAVATQGAVLDLKAELERLGRGQADALGEMRKLVEAAMGQLARAGLTRKEGPRRREAAGLAELLEECAAEDVEHRYAGFSRMLKALDRLGPGPSARRAGSVRRGPLGMTFVWVPAGTFLMGSPPEEPQRRGDEVPHGVTLTRGFYLAAHPVTQARWQAVMKSNPSPFAGADLPVQGVSWDDCQQFCLRLAEQEGGTYRLPTEAEWEHACRAGSAAPFHFGASLDLDQANFDGRDGGGTFRGTPTPVGAFLPSAWGLYDMHGNVYEWCADVHGDYPAGHVSDPAGPTQGDARVLRGGSWFSAAWYCRSAYRYWADPATRDGHIGFRIVLGS